MKKDDKSVGLVIITLLIIFGTLCGGTLKANASENTMTSCTYVDYSPCPRVEGYLLKESINELKERGSLTEDDVKNINFYMTKDRESKEAEIKERIYKIECEKIDKMVSEKVISKEKGEKLKETVKENIQDMKKNIKRLNSK
ncbi:hypothetical protein [Terrisporobacter mayombei]|uniref:DUF2680 domain-containing protein n=1 Tax=Terrisporobacter mayombei TaxID=1541 RepID=A0ABY9QAF9_9FIRM|nr:hypothetical protein [Terrisporobacter mayombei]MCC3869590.1 hypothetical protein [Terrisporobacter mayombei]WMT83472.1 hypothetical protein TEMA_39890 [Terrisporobacter mayombei]